MVVGRIRQYKAKQVSLPPDKWGNSNLACTCTYIYSEHIHTRDRSEAVYGETSSFLGLETQRKYSRCGDGGYLPTRGGLYTHL